MIYSNNHDHLFEILKHTLKSPPYLRSTKQIKDLMSFMSTLLFFKTNIIPSGEEILFKTCENLTYEFHKKGSQICKIGDAGDKFFVILSGLVKITVPIDEGTKEICRLSEGKSFGEYSLLNNQPKIANVECVEDCHFAVLAKESYLNILGKIENKRVDEMVKFLRKFNLFRKWGKQVLIKISYFMEERVLTRKSIVFKEGERAEYIYFIKSGELEIVKSIKNEKVSKSVYFRNVSPIIKANIAIIGPGEISGEETVTSEFYSYTCRVYSTTATLMKMSKKDFEEHVNSEDAQVLMNKDNEIRKIDRNIRVNSLKELKYSPSEDPFEHNFPVIKSPESNNKFFVYRHKIVSQTPTRKSYYKLLGESDIKHIISKSKIDIASPLNLQLSKKNSVSRFSPLSHKSSYKFFEQKYLYPMKIEQKRINQRRTSNKIA